MQKIHWISTKGDISNRIERSYTRMNSEWYTADKVFAADENNWPGDLEGRTILALTALGKSLNRQPNELAQMIENLFLNLNEMNYLGLIRKKETFDEQQISGHSWLLSGLVDYYQWKKDDRVLAVIKGIVNNLMKPTFGYYKYYPINPEERIVEGGAAGHLTGKKVGYWLTSSDTGCAFIMLDGITRAYELIQDKSLEPLIEEMIEMYFTIDFIKSSVQTHATLSGLRGIIRYYQLGKNQELLKKCEDIYSIYLAHGRTENYANYNWFGRPTWTEPCAIVDAYMVSMELAKITGKSIYIEEANYIYYNSLSYAQRENGGFGCDVCSGVEGDFISPKDDLFEAYWCCTIRGAKGLAYVLEEAIQVEETSMKYLMYLEGTFSVTFNDGSILLKNEGELQRTGRYQINVLENTTITEKTIMLFIPSWVSDFNVEYNDRTYKEAKQGYVSIKVLPGECQRINIRLTTQLRKVSTLNSQTIKGVYRYLHGYLMLAQESAEKEIVIDEKTVLTYKGEGYYIDEVSGTSLKPLMDYVEIKSEDNHYKTKKILFSYRNE